MSATEFRDAEVLRVVATSKRPCNLERCEVRRVSQNYQFPLVAYHVCCPRCGFVTIAFQNHEELVITETTDPNILTFSKPVRCTYCAVLIHVSEGNIQLELDGDVRNLRFR
jgi:hypothetical protein